MLLETDERRVLSGSDKARLYIRANGRCEKCNEVLVGCWDAHHNVRWIDGGITDVRNMTALCSECHKKVHKTIKCEGLKMIKPRGWQTRAINKFDSNENKFFLLEATPGAGKTVFSGFCANNLLDAKVCDFIVIVVPTTTLKETFKDSFNKDLKLQITPNLSSFAFPPKNYVGGTVTYQQLPNMIDTFRTWSDNGTKLFFVFDEIHHASEINIWGAATEQCAEMAVKTLGITGTPFRSDGCKISFVNYKDEKSVPDFSFGYSDAISSGICRELLFAHDDGVAEYIFKGEKEEREISYTAKKDIGRVSSTVFSKDSEWLNAVISKANDKLTEYRLSSHDAGGLIICRPGKNEEDEEKHIFDVAKILKKITGEDPLVITHDEPSSNDKIKAFKNGSARWILSIRKISEGVDIPRLRVCVLACCPTTELLFRQIIGRCVRNINKNDLEDATIFMAKFPELLEMAKRVRAEAEAGLKNIQNEELDRNPIHFDRFDSKSSSFVALSATHQDGGGTSTFGEYFTPDEISWAEKIKSKNKHYGNTSITVIASLIKDIKTTNFNKEQKDEKPMADQICALRKELVNKVRIVASQRSPNDIKQQISLIWDHLFKAMRVKNLDDLCNNRPIEDIKKTINIVELMMELHKETC